MNPFSVLSDNQQYTVGEYEKRDTYGYKPIGEVSKNVFCFEKEIAIQEITVLIKRFKI